MKSLVITTMGQAWSRILAAPDPTAPAAGSGDVKNPLDGIKPDLSVFGAAFESVWGRVFGGIWALGIAAAAGMLGKSLLDMNAAKKLGNTTLASEATSDVRYRAAALGALVALPVIVGAIIVAFGG